MLEFGLAFILLQLIVSTLLMAFPIIVVMLWVRVLEFVAGLLWGG